MAEEETLESGENGRGYGGLFRAEIDTSAPFESVKEAVTMFGGLGFRKPLPSSLTKSSPDSFLSCDVEEVDLTKMEEKAVELEKDLILKGRDTLEVLKELEITKVLVEELKSKLQKEEAASHLNISSDSVNEEEEEKENNPNISLQKLRDSSDLAVSSAPGMIMMELKQAKLNLTKTTSNLAEIRASVELYNKKIERERMSLERTRERLRSSTTKILSLEEEINRTRLKLQEVPNDGNDVMVELQQLNSEAVKYEKIGEAVKCEVMKVMSQVELTKAKIKTAEIRLVAARRMMEAARASEAVTLLEVDALSGVIEENIEKITLTLEEYSSLRNKARDDEEFSNLKVLEAMLQVDEANVSKADIIKQVEEAMEEVKTSKQALENALDRVEAANSGKLVVEHPFRRWRSENGEKRWSIQNSTEFMNPVLKPPTLSIGQILSRKLLVTEEFESRKCSGTREVSLGQMLGKHNGELSTAWKLDKECGNPKKLPAKRKKFGFARFSMLLPKQSRKKKPSPTAG